MLYALIAVSLVSNLIILFLVFTLFRKDRAISGSVEASIKNLENTQKQIEFLQNRFKESLENIISKNNLIIENTSNNIMKYYQDTVTTLTLNYNQNSTKLMQLLQDNLKNNIDKLSEQSVEELNHSKDLVDQEIKKELEDLKKEMKKYTNDKFKEVDEKVYQIVAETAKNTVGKVINIVDHQDLVMSALEQAKKDKFFN